MLDSLATFLASQNRKIAGIMALIVVCAFNIPMLLMAWLIEGATIGVKILADNTAMIAEFVGKSLADDIKPFVNPLTLVAIIDYSNLMKVLR